MRRLKDKLKDGELLFGPFIKLCHPDMLEIGGLTGFDFAIIDTEHGEISYGKYGACSQTSGNKLCDPCLS